MNTRGFTLVEMIVSLAIFSVVAVIAIGALLKVIDANKKAQSIQSSVTNLNFALESMSRDIRTGTDIECSTSIPGQMPGSLGLTPSACAIGQGRFIAFNSTRVDPNNTSCDHNLINAYGFFTDTGGVIHLQKAEQTSCDSSGYSLTDLISASDMSITGYELGLFYPVPSSYPLAFIRLTGYAGQRAQDKTYVDIETAVSSRSVQ